MNEDENIIHQNLWNTVKAVLKERCIPIKSHQYINKEERSQINYLNFYLRKLKKKSKLNPKQEEGNNKD